MKKMNNKGFSMVELIIVIAIMAILAAALAPALIKYINKSRLSTDISTGTSIASAIQTALSNESAYDDCTSFTAQNFGGSAGSNPFSGYMSSEVLETLGGDLTKVKVKSKKDMTGSTITGDCFTLNVDPVANKVEVYLGSSATADFLVSPTVAKNLTEK